MEWFRFKKSVGKDTSVEVGYLGSRGFHLQRAHLINNTLPAPDRSGRAARSRPHLCLKHHLAAKQHRRRHPKPNLPVSTINLLENSAQSWYDAGYINVRRHYSHGFSFLGNYTFAKNLTNAPDFRSAMDEASIPQNNLALNLEKGPSCDVRQRFALSAVYAIPAYDRAQWMRLITQDWNLSTILPDSDRNAADNFRVRHTANSGTVLERTRSGRTRQDNPSSAPERAPQNSWFNPAAFAARPLSPTQRGTKLRIRSRNATLDLAVARAFRLTERANFQFPRRSL